MIFYFSSKYLDNNVAPAIIETTPSQKKTGNKIICLFEEPIQNY